MSCIFEFSIKRRNYALRSTTSLPFKLADGLEFAIGIYYLIKPQKLASTLLDSETDERVECLTRYIPVKTEKDGGKSDDGVEPIEGGEINYVREIGGEKVTLNRSEVENLRRFDRPG